jgi:hypothetical protein
MPPRRIELEVGEVLMKRLLVYWVAVLSFVVGFSGGQVIAAPADGTVVFHNRNVLIEETFAERTFCYIDYRGQHCRVNTEGSWRVSSKRRVHFWIAVACTFKAWHTTPDGDLRKRTLELNYFVAKGHHPTYRWHPVDSTSDWDCAARRVR